MDTLLQIGLSNALVATLLAVLAATVSGVCRRPALVHTLWLLVLLKLGTPSPFVFPVTLPGGVPFVPIASSESGLATDSSWADAINPDSHLSWSETIGGLAWALAWWLADSVSKLLFLAWLAGSALWMALVAGRSYRFARLLRYGRPAPVEMQMQAHGLAEHLGMKHCPEIRLLPGVLSPMLWGLGSRVWLLLPVDLVGRLHPEQLRTLLVHELAHARRRDPWVRVLELIVLSLYWWLPVAWWARRQLREAEEQCCDAWVVSALPASAPSYATALVETVAFLSAARPALPPAGTGVGYVRLLEKRLNLILLGAPPKQMSVAGLIGVLGVGLLLLPVRPVVGEDKPEPTSLKVVNAVQPILGPAAVVEMALSEKPPVVQPITQSVLLSLPAPAQKPLSYNPGKKPPPKQGPPRPEHKQGPGAGGGPPPPPPGGRGGFGPPPGGGKGGGKKGQVARVLAAADPKAAAVMNQHPIWYHNKSLLQKKPRLRFGLVSGAYQPEA